MAETKSLDFLIVGFGLAGGLLAWELIQRGCRVVVIDNGRMNASQVAAGLINPVTGKRFSKTADFDRLLPAAQDCYAGLAAVFKRTFLIEKPMLRILRSEAELAQCRKRLLDAAYREYLGRLDVAEEEGVFIGYLEQKQTGYLDIRPLLACLSQYLRERGAFREAEVGYRDIRFDHEPGWGEINARQIIFCEGFRMRENPWFCWLPLQPVKGEILTLTSESAFPDRIINDGHWLVPTGGGEARLGATFGRETIDTRITEDGKAELMAAGEKLYPGLARARLSAQGAGVRPCTQDRQPFIGRHPKYPWLNIFNGFGAKGSLSIPWHCRRFADYLLKSEALPPSCDIKRHEKTHFPDN